MSSMVGIDPELMTKLINGMRRVSGMMSDVDLQVEQALTSLGLPLWGPSALRGICQEMSDRIPSLQGRLDLILAEPDRESGRGGVLWANESDWLSKSPAEGAASAKAVATKLREQLKSHALDPMLVAELERHRNDPYFALALAKAIPPHELEAMINRAYGAGLPPSARPSQRDVAVQERFVTMLSELLGTASRGVGALRLPGGYADQLVDGIESPQDAFAVKGLLRDGTFDHTFLLTVVRKLHDKDLAHPPDPSLPRDAWTMPGATDASLGDLSPMGTALVALAHHPAVAQDFFTDPQRKPLDYLMRRHPWGGDADGELGWAIEVASTEFRDHDLPVGGSRGYKSALIASWAVRFWSDPKVQANLPGTRAHVGKVLAHYIGDVHRAARAFSEEVSGVMADRDPDKNLRGKEPYGALLDASGVKAAMTWAFADEGAFQHVVAAHGVYATKMLDEVAGKIEAEVRADFEEWRKSHPQATVRQLDAARQDILEERLSRSGGAEFAQAAQGLSRTTWLISDAANISGIEEAKEKDARFATFRQMVESVVGLAPGPQGTFVGFTVDGAKETIFGQTRSDNEDQARKDADTALGLSKHMFADLTAAVMMRHGLFGDGSSPSETHPHRHEDFSPGSAGYFMANGEIVPWHDMNAAQRRAYEDWLTLNPTGRVFKETNQSIALGFKESEANYARQGS
ncbi:hypothetical protein ACWDA3_30015 [Nonomuraea rubra]